MHEGDRLSYYLSRPDYDMLLDYIVRFRWDSSLWSVGFSPRRFASLLDSLPLVQHEWF